MVKKLKQNKLKQKQKQKQKQSVKVSQNVKVILNDLKKKRVIKKKSTGVGVNRNKPNISLTVVNPYQQFLPQPLQAQPQPVKQSELNKSNPANPSILRTLGALNNQNTMIQNELRDLREFSKNQQESYNYLLSAQRETPENKIDKMLKNKKRIASSMNWNNIINNEKKSEEKIIKEEKDSPSIYQWINPYPNQPDPRFVSTRPQVKTIQQRSILNSWLEQARENIAQPQQLLSSFIEEDEGVEEEKEDYSAIREMFGRLPQVLSSAQPEEPEEPSQKLAASTYEELMSEPYELPEDEEEEEQKPMTVKGSKKINKTIKKKQMLEAIAEGKAMEQEDERSNLMREQEHMTIKVSKKLRRKSYRIKLQNERKGMAEEDIQSNLMREAFTKQLEEGAGAGAEEPVKSKRGRKPGSKNRSAEEIQQEKRQKEQNRFIRSLSKGKKIKIKKEKK